MLAWSYFLVGVWERHYFVEFTGRSWLQGIAWWVLTVWYFLVRLAFKVIAWKDLVGNFCLLLGWKVFHGRCWLAGIDR